MKTTFFISSFVFLTTVVFSQVLRPIFSDDVQIPMSEYLEYLGQKSDNKMVFVTGSVIDGQRNNFITTYRPNKELERFQVEEPLKNAFGFEFFTLDGNIYRWYMAKHKKSGSILKSIVKYDQEGKALDNKSMGSIKYNKYEDQPSQALYYSPDSSKVLTVEVIDEDHKKEPVSISLVVLEKNLQESHKRTFRGKNKSQISTDHCVGRITNQGDAYLLQKVTPNGETEKIVNRKLVPNYYYELVKVNAEGKTKAYRIDNLKSFSNIQNLFITSEGYPMVMTGINESSDEGSPLIGFNCHVYKVEQDSFVTQKTTFSRKLKEWGVTKEMNYKILFNFFDVHNDYLIDDDQIHVLLERNYFDLKGKGRKGAYTVNVKKTAIVFSISNEGKLVESMYVPKVHDSKISTNTTKLFKANDKVYLMYMLNDKNKNGDLSELMFYEQARDNIKSNTVFSLATKEDGKIKKWNVKASRDLMLYSFLLHNNDEKIFLPIVDYSALGKARMGLMTLRLPE